MRPRHSSSRWSEREDCAGCIERMAAVLILTTCVEMVPVYELQEAEYDVACKHCWRNGKQPQDPTREASDASGSDEDDESSSSESEAS